MTSSPDNLTIGKGKAYFRSFGGVVVLKWVTLTEYSAGAVVMLADGTLIKTTAGGTSGASEPTATLGVYGTDGDIDDWVEVPWVDFGNCPSFKVNGEYETLEHFSDRTPIKTRDKKVILTRKGSLGITLDEMTKENLMLALMGKDSSGKVKIFGETQVYGQVKLEQTNEVGNKFNWFFGNVSFIPGKEIEVIGNSWMTVEITGEVNMDANGEFGTLSEPTP